MRDGDDALRVEVHRRDVPLEAMPIVADTLGLPMTGMADVEVDISIPKAGGIPQYSRATGTFATSCPAGCQLGDDRAKLALAKLDASVAFGHVDLGRIDIRGKLEDGHLDITRWDLASKDLELHVRLRVDLADDVGTSKLAGCVWFKPDRSLLDRDPKTHAVLTTTGASADADGYYQIQLEGTIDKLRMLAHSCRSEKIGLL